MRLADFIQANIEPILMEWEAFARGIWPGTVTDHATLRDHAEVMLHATVADMKSGQSDEQQSDKSKGKVGDGRDAARVNRVSAEHGVGRVGSGFDLSTVIAEYRALRASVIRLWRESEPVTGLNDLYDVTRFNESIDQSLTQAVVAYSQHVERERTAASQEQARQSDELRKLNGELLVSSVRQHELTERAEHATAAMREAKEEAESANRAKDEFVAVVSHELRTPLSAILLWAHLLRSGAVRGPDQEQALAVVVQSAKAQQQLIEDLLDVSRITSGKLSLALQTVELAGVVHAAVEAVRPMAEAKGIEIALAAGRRAGTVRVDPDRVRQVVWNLLTNAVKFSDGGGTVRVRLRRQDGGVEVQISDHGAGIDPQFLPHVFERFRQADASATRLHGGLGLGLAISQQIVELHGGTIRAESGGQGKGATFTVELPLVATAVTTKAANRRRARQAKDVLDAAAGLAPSASLAGVRVLLVEDEPETRRVTALVLELSGAEVTAAGSAADALVAFRQAFKGQRRYDVVVSDIGMPGRDGYRLIQDLRGIEGQRPATPAIAVTAYARGEDREKALAAGFQMHLTKPVEAAGLIAAIAVLAGRSGAE